MKCLLGLLFVMMLVDDVESQCTSTDCSAEACEMPPSVTQLLERVLLQQEQIIKQQQQQQEASNKQQQQLDKIIKQQENNTQLQQLAEEKVSVIHQEAMVSTRYGWTISGK